MSSEGCKGALNTYNATAAESEDFPRKIVSVLVWPLQLDEPAGATDMSQIAVPHARASHCLMVSDVLRAGIPETYLNQAEENGRTQRVCRPALLRVLKRRLQSLHGAQVKPWIGDLGGALLVHERGVSMHQTSYRCIQCGIVADALGHLEHKRPKGRHAVANAARRKRLDEST